MNPHDDPASFDALHRVAVHIVARARQQATGRFSLRVTPGGFGTTEFGIDARRVRVVGATLLVESDRPGGAAVGATAIDGASLAALAEAAGVDLTAPLDVGHDTPALGDPDEPLHVTDGTAAALSATYSLGQEILDRTVAGLPGEAAPTLARLWPEHFDVAIEAVGPGGGRVNLGVSPGDGFSAEPYCYVGPWTTDRPGDPAFWNAPFGAFRTLRELGDDPAAGGAAFLLDGHRRLI